MLYFERQWRAHHTFLISVFPNNGTSVLYGDLPTGVAPCEGWYSIGRCSNNGVRRRFVDLFMAVVALKRTVVDLMQKGK